MREPCLYCVRKHLGQAEVLMGEALRGYPEHKWLAVGHLSEAEEELVSFDSELVEKMRESRLEYMHNSVGYPTLTYLSEITKLETSFMGKDLTEEELEKVKKINFLYNNDELPTEVEQVEQFNSKISNK